MPWASCQIRGLHMRRECRERFPRHWLQRKPLVSDPGMHHGTCVTHVPWCISGSLIRYGGGWGGGGGGGVGGVCVCGGGGEVWTFPAILGACATRNFTYLARGPFTRQLMHSTRLTNEICGDHIVCRAMHDENACSNTNDCSHEKACEIQSRTLMTRYNMLQYYIQQKQNKNRSLNPHWTP